MTENKQIALIFLITLTIGLIGSACILFFPPLMQPDLVISRYDASFSWNGNLSEEYMYTVRDDGVYRSLNRKFDDPLYHENKSFPFVEFGSVTVPQGSTAYVKDSDNQVFLPGSNRPVPDVISSYAAAGEMGAYNPSYYDAGVYQVGYQVKMHPPVEYDSSHAHLNIQLASDHIPYTDITIIIPALYVEEVFPHPDTLSVKKQENTYIITGSVSENENLGVELVLTPQILQVIPGFPVYTENVEGKTKDANRVGTNLIKNGVQILFSLALLFVILVPFVFLGIWYRYGREKPFIVPKSISFIPDISLLPWMVNLIFKGDAVSFDDDGFYATLLSLHRDKKISIQTKPEKNLLITVINDKSQDRYEQDVLNFLATIGDNGVVDTSVLSGFTSIADSDSSAQETVLQYQKLLKSVQSATDEALITKYIINGRSHLYPVLGIGIAGAALSFFSIILFPGFLSGLASALVLYAIVSVQAGIALVFPATLFGKWKGDYYKEKLEWDGFTTFLSDFVQLKKYSPEDLVMWGDWLIYGTALGVGDSVAKAMEQLHIQLPFSEESPGLYRSSLTGAFLPVMAYSPPSSSGSGGGSFGGGGGFGGGGAGGW